MAETSEQDRQRDEAGREAIRRLSCPVKGRVMLAQVFTMETDHLKIFQQNYYQ